MKDDHVSLHFLGAAGEVTGSRTLLKVFGKSYLVDCGLFQGPKDARQKNWTPSGDIDPAHLDAVFLTHAHLDHSGYLACLQAQGYKGPIYCSTGTFDIVRLLLLDAAHLEEEQASYANKSKYSNHVPALPLFSTEDVMNTLPLFTPKPRDEWIKLSETVSFRFIRAGHIIGASMVQFSVRGSNGPKYITFSGDIGHSRSLTMRPPDVLMETDTLILESTYGNRLHQRSSPLDQIGPIAAKTLKRGGVLIIPSFAVGRAQEILYAIRKLEDRGDIKPVPVILDSPLSSAATSVFQKHPEDHLLGSSFSGGDDQFLPHRCEITSSPDESMMACMRDGPLIIIAASGMLNGGRILHHLKTRLPDEKNTVLFSGYQAEGTKGRWLQDNADKAESLRIHHREISLAAEIATVDSLSGHGDYEDLIEWIRQMRKKPQRVFLNHGSVESVTEFAKHIRQAFKDIDVTEVLKPNKFVIDIDS